MVGIFHTGSSGWSPYLSGISHLNAGWASSVAASTAYMSPMMGMLGGGFGVGAVGVAAAWAAYRVATAPATNWYGSPMMWRPGASHNVRQPRRGIDEGGGNRWHDQYAEKHGEGRSTRTRRGSTDKPDATPADTPKRGVTGTEAERKAAATAMRGRGGAGFKVLSMNHKSGIVTVKMATVAGTTPKVLAAKARRLARSIARKHHVTGLRFRYTGAGKPPRAGKKAPAATSEAKLKAAAVAMQGKTGTGWKITKMDPATKIVTVHMTVIAGSTAGSIAARARRTANGIARRSGVVGLKFRYTGPGKP